MIFENKLLKFFQTECLTDVTKFKILNGVMNVFKHQKIKKIIFFLYFSLFNFL